MPEAKVLPFDPRDDAARRAAAQRVPADPLPADPLPTDPLPGNRQLGAMPTTS